MALRFSSSKRHRDCFTGRAPARMSSECSATSLGMSGMSEGLHAKNLAFARRKSTSTASLFGVELGADPDLLAGVVAGVERDRLNRFGWFEVAGAPLCAGCLFVEALQVGDEGFRLDKGLGVLHALHVALVSVTVWGSDGDGSIGARHLELEVRVLGDGHELGVARSSHHRVVGPSEPNHLKSEGFLSEVGGSSEANGQVKLPKGLDTLTGDDPVKWWCTGPDRGQIDPQEP
jgi:hypothetical protein